MMALICVPVRPNETHPDGWLSITFVPRDGVEVGLGGRPPGRVGDLLWQEISLTYPSVPPGTACTDAGRKRSTLRLTFSGVALFRFLQSGCYDPEDEGQHQDDGFGFVLRMSKDSRFRSRFIEKARTRWAMYPDKQGEAFEFVRVEETRHYTLTFDDLGTFDFLCTDVDIETWVEPLHRGAETLEASAHGIAENWRYVKMDNRQKWLQSFHKKLQQAEAEGWVAELKGPEIVAIVATVRDLPVDGCQPVASKIARILATYQELVERPPWKQDEESDEYEW